MATTAGELAEKSIRFVVGALEAHADPAGGHLPGWRIPRTFAGHRVGADVRADVCYTLHHLAEAGVDEVAGERVDDVLTGLLAEVDGSSTHTFFSYRIAETLLRHGPFEGNPLLAPLTEAQRAEVAAAVDSSDWLELLDAGVLPRNYAGVLARCELGRVRLGLVEGSGRLDELVERVAAVLGENPASYLDDSNDRVGRYDIYTADVWLFTEPLADRLGPVWTAGMTRALELVAAVSGRDGAAVPWGRSTGDLAAALTLELGAWAARATRAGSPVLEVPGSTGAWLRRADDAARAVVAGFDRTGLTTAHWNRNQDGYRGPERRLQLTFDLLGKVAWAAGALRGAGDVGSAASVPATYGEHDRWIAFEAARPAGVWTLRRPGADLVVPFVGITRSHYLPGLHRPGTWEVPIDRDLPTWSPLVLAGLGRYTAGGLPTSVEHGPGRLTARWDGFAPSGRGLDGDDAGPPLAGTREAHLELDGRTVVLRDHLTFAEPPATVTVAVPEVPTRGLRVTWSCPTPHTTARIPVEGLSEWRTPWSTVRTLHQLDLDPATELRYEVRATPDLHVGSTAHGHHYDRSLYRPLERDHGIVGRPPPVGWEAATDPDWADLDLVHLHWPEWVCFDDLDAHRAAIDRIGEEGVPLVWTAHNLTPHEKREAHYDAIYQAWAEAADSVIHHSAWGEQRFRARYRFRPDCRHEVIPHGHFGAMWAAAGLPSRVEAEAWLGLAPAGLRIGIVGAPRAEKLVQVVLDAVAACRRPDVQLACWSLGPDDVVPDDPRIVVAEPYRNVDRTVYATRLAACDALALVFDADGDMLATGAASDAVGLALPALRSDWGYLVEHLGEAGIPVGQTVESVAAAIDDLTPERLDEARAAAGRRRDELSWDRIASRTAALFERTVSHLP